MNFVGFASPLSTQMLSHLARTLDTDLPSIWAVLSVESAGCGFLPDRRPKILFERHVFHRLTHGNFDQAAPDLSNPEAGGYGPRDPAFQYKRLARAIALNEMAALESASWGLAQIMGFNARSVGFSDARAMVTAFTDSEDQQVGAMMGFVTARGLAPALRNHDWASFAAKYNGPNFQAKGYDKSLERFHARYETGPLPDLRVRAVQMALGFVGTGDAVSVDGWFGEKTQEALIAFQVAERLEPTGRPDEATLPVLIRKVGWQMIS